MNIRIFENSEHIKYFIRNAKYDKNIDYWSYVKYIKDEKLRLEYEKICKANGLVSLFCTCFKKTYNVNLYDFVRSNDYKVLLNSYNRTENKDILSSVFGIDNIKSSNVLNTENTKNFYLLALRSFYSNYKTERNKIFVYSKVKEISNDYNYYFTLDDKLKKNSTIIQALLDNAKYREGNYGEVLPYVTNPHQIRQLKKLIKINSYCALYLYIKTGSTNIPNQEIDNECIKDIISKDLKSIDKKNPIYKIGKYVLKYIESEYTKVINDYIGTKGKCYDLDKILRKFPNTNLSNMNKRLRYLSHKALTNHINPIVPIAIILVTSTVAIGTFNAIKSGIDHNNAVDYLKNSIENSNYYLDDYGSIDDNIEDDDIYDEALGDETYAFVTINGLNSKDKIDAIINSGKNVGIVIRPNTTSFDEFNRNMTNLVIYYNFYNDLKLPVLYDISVLKDNMKLNCQFASQFLGVMDKLGIKAGLYGDESIINTFNMEYNKYEDKYKSITSFDNLVILNNMDNLESNLKRLSSEYNASMVQLSNGYIIFNKDYVDSYDVELLTSYILGENETIEDVAYKLNLSTDYLCDINHISNPSDIGSGMAIKIPKFYRKIEKIGPGNPLLVNLDNGDNVIKGIDVSLWNDNIDWKELKKQGVGFAVLRIADCLTENYDAPYVIDDQLSNNIKGCIENNIPYSFYYYTRATNPNDAALEAKFVSRILHENGIESGNIFIDIETEPSEHGFKETLDEKIQISYNDEYREECVNIIDSAKQIFEENGFSLMYYCGNTTYKRLNEWLEGGDYWTTSHATYDVGAPDDYNNIKQTDGLKFSDFSYDSIIKNNQLKDNIYVVQFCQWGKFDNVYDYQGLPQFYDIDYASENFINDYFYIGENVNIHLEEDAKVL